MDKDFAGVHAYPLFEEERFNFSLRNVGRLNTRNSAFTCSSDCILHVGVTGNDEIRPTTLHYITSRLNFWLAVFGLPHLASYPVIYSDISNLIFFLMPICV